MGFFNFLGRKAQQVRALGSKALGVVANVGGKIAQAAGNLAPAIGALNPLAGGIAAAVGKIANAASGAAQAVKSGDNLGSVQDHYNDARSAAASLPSPGQVASEVKSVVKGAFH